MYLPVMSDSQKILVNDKRTINGWAFFDWANSAYSLVISTAIFPIYFIAVTNDTIDLFGRHIENSVFYSYLVSGSFLIVALFSPLLGGIADYGDKRMFFMRLFSTVGSIACVFLFFFEDHFDIVLGSLAFGVATIGHASSIIFYDAYLPDIATPDRYDKVSAKGFAFGYIGSVLLLLFIIFMSLKPEVFGIDPSSSLPYRIGFALVGIWWFGFSQITFRRLPKSKMDGFEDGIIKKGYLELKGVIKELKTKKNIQKFLTAFFFYSAGVQTVIYLATVFAEKELAFKSSELIGTVLLLQLVAIAGAFTFAKLSKNLGNKRALLIAIVIWFGICLAASFVASKMLFYGIAALVGLVLGGIQSLSRSTYSKLLDSDEQELTSYFSFYDVLYYLSVVFGTFAFGLVEQLTNNIRYSVLVLAFFFVIGFLLLIKVKIEKTIKVN